MREEENSEYSLRLIHCEVIDEKGSSILPKIEILNFRKPRLHKPQGRSVTRIPPDRPFTTTTGPQERRAPSRTPSRAPPPEQEITSTGGLFGLIGDVLGGPSKVEAKEPSALLGSAGKSGAVKAKSRVDLSPRREEKRHEEKKEIEEVVDFRQVGSSEELGSFEPPRRPSGVGLVVGSRQPSVASSMRSSPRRTPSRVVASPRPTTISGNDEVMLYSMAHCRSDEYSTR